MTGSHLYLIEKTQHFELTLKKLLKTYKSKQEKELFLKEVNDYINKLLENPFRPESELESLPSNCKLSSNCYFYKLRWKYKKGASGQIRLIYLVDKINKIIIPLWIYTHEQFAKRPSDKDLNNLLQDY